MIRVSAQIPVEEQTWLDRTLFTWTLWVLLTKKSRITPTRFLFMLTTFDYNKWFTKKTQLTSSSIPDTRPWPHHRKPASNLAVKLKPVPDSLSCLWIPQQMTEGTERRVKGVPTNSEWWQFISHLIFHVGVLKFTAWSNFYTHRQWRSHTWNTQHTRYLRSRQSLILVPEEAAVMCTVSAAVTNLLWSCCVIAEAKFLLVSVCMTN